MLKPMSRHAPAATRAVKVLSYLGTHPRESFTLSELAERLGISVASMHALLASLADEGFVTRDRRTKTFTLGPAVVALGTAALETNPAIDAARDAARALAERARLEVAITTLAGDDQILFLARAGRPTPRGVPIHVGQRMPFEPPLGAVFVAWTDADGWLAKAEDPEPLRELLGRVRADGYSIALEAQRRIELSHALDDLASLPNDTGRQRAVSSLITELRRRQYHASALEPASRYDVSVIAAPVFGASGETVLALTMHGFAGGLTGKAILALAGELRDTALVITKETHGRVPRTPPPIEGDRARVRRATS
jgi:DNA-binding IclR family transcriptional regulator